MVDIRDLIKWFINNNATLKNIGFDEKVKLQKLLYYSQAMHYAVYGEPLFAERIEAWVHGPVVPAAYYAHEYTTLLKDAICASKEEINNLFDEKVDLILKVVNFVYGSKTGKELEQISHQEEPWSILEEQTKQRLNPEIKKEEIKGYYAPLKDIFEAFRGFDFESEITEHINGNNFTYNSKEMDLSEDDILYLWQIGESSRDQSYYIQKNKDRALEIIQ